MVAFFWLGFFSIVPFALGWAIRIYVLDDDVPIRGQKPRFGHLTRAPKKDRSA